ncbi:Flp family type IVb pilin [Pseudomonas viridiflava]|nr:Flp family type IVb pilin [Pseudomonas viridiflava]
MRSFVRDGASTQGIDYALLAAMVAVALVAFVPTISGKLSTMFTSIQNAL